MQFTCCLCLCWRIWCNWDMIPPQSDTAPLVFWFNAVDCWFRDAKYCETRSFTPQGSCLAVVEPSSHPLLNPSSTDRIVSNLKTTAPTVQRDSGLENKLWANHDITDALVEVPRSAVVGCQWLWNASATQDTMARASFTEVMQFHGSHFRPSGMIHVDAALCRHSRMQINTFTLRTHNTKPPFQNMLPTSLKKIHASRSNTKSWFTIILQPCQQTLSNVPKANSIRSEAPSREFKPEASGRKTVSEITAKP
jgi:hypothetical protein